MEDAVNRVGAGNEILNVVKIQSTYRLCRMEGIWMIILCAMRSHRWFLSREVKGTNPCVFLVDNVWR